MPRGYWSVILAFAGLALAANAHAQPVGNDAGSNAAAAQSNQGPAKNANIAADVSRISSTPESQNANADPYEKERNEREIRDLQAQENSAYWAEWMFYATCVAVLLSVVGIILIYITFRAQRKGNDIAGETAALQLRPYVMFTDEGGEAEKFETGEKIQFGIQNFGQTPARNLQISRSWDIVKRPIGDITLELGEPETYGMIGPNQKIRDNLTIDMPPALIAQIASGDIFVLRLKISYEWGVSDTDCHDCTLVLSNSGYNPWKLCLISKEERERTE